MNLSLIFEDKQEKDIDKMISDSKTYEDNQGMEGIPDDEPHSRWGEEREQARQKNVWKRKQRRFRDLIASLNRLSASLLASICVAERQIEVLQNLQDLFLTSCRTKIKGYEKGHPLRENPSYKNIAPIPILSENSEQIWPNMLDAIGEAIQERKCFMKKINKLVESMDIRRKIV